MTVISNPDIFRTNVKMILGDILDNMKLLLDCQDEAIKYMINYIIIGGLGLVIPQIRTNYPDFSFSF